MSHETKHHITPPKISLGALIFSSLLSCGLFASPFVAEAADYGMITSDTTITGDDATATGISTVGNLTVDGDYTLTLSGSRPDFIYIGNNGIVTMTGNVNIKGSPSGPITGSPANAIVVNGHNGALDIQGSADITGEFNNNVITNNDIKYMHFKSLTIHEVGNNSTNTAIVLGKAVKGEIKVDGDLTVRNIIFHQAYSPLYQMYASNGIKLSANNIFIENAEVSANNFLGLDFEIGVFDDKDGLINTIQIQNLTNTSGNAYGAYLNGVKVDSRDSKVGTNIYVKNIASKTGNVFGVTLQDALDNWGTIYDASGNFNNITISDLKAKQDAIGFTNYLAPATINGMLDISGIESDTGNAYGLMADDLTISNGISIKDIRSNTGKAFAIEADNAQKDGIQITSGSNTVNVLEGDLWTMHDDTQGIGAGKISAEFKNKDSHFIGDTLSDGDSRIDLSFAGGSYWSLADNTTDQTKLSGTLALDNGNVFLSDSTSKQRRELSLTNLTGKAGTFYLNTDIAADSADTTDQVNIQSGAGAHHLSVTNTNAGTDPTTAEMSTYLARQENGSASFDLANQNGLVEAGTYFYGLASRNVNGGTEWYLKRSDKPTPTPSTDAAANYAGVYYQTSQWLADTETLRDRMGEIRYSTDKDWSVWAKYIGTRERFGGFNGRTLKSSTSGVQFGADKRITGTPWTVGIAGKVASENQNVALDSGASMADVTMYAAHLYGTYLKDDGTYLDLVTGYSRSSRDIDFHQMNGTPVTGSFDSNGYGLSIEAGRQFQFKKSETNHLFWEPQAQLSYYHVDGGDYSFSNGMAIHHDGADSLIGRLGVAIGQTYEKEDGRFWQWDFKAGINHEFKGDETVYVNGNPFHSDLGDTRFYCGVGLNYKPTENTRYFLNLTTEHGHHYDRDIAFNLGIRYEW